MWKYLAASDMSYIIGGFEYDYAFAFLSSIEYYSLPCIYIVVCLTNNKNNHLAVYK